MTKCRVCGKERQIGDTFWMPGAIFFAKNPSSIGMICNECKEFNDMIKKAYDEWAML